MDTMLTRRMPKTRVHELAEMIFHMRPSEAYVKMVVELMGRLSPSKEGHYLVPPELVMLLSPAEADTLSEIPRRLMDQRQDVVSTATPVIVTSVARSTRPSKRAVDHALFALERDRYRRPMHSLTDEEWLLFRCGDYLDSMAWCMAVGVADQQGDQSVRYRKAYDMVYTSGWSEQSRKDKYQQLFNDEGKAFLSWRSS